MITPEIVVIQWLKVIADWNHARASSIEGDCGYVVAIDSGRSKHITSRSHQSSHVVCVGLCCEIRVVAAAMQGIGSGCGSKRSSLAVDYCYSNAQSTEINPRHN
jgi:hypothetical protein